MVSAAHKAVTPAGRFIAVPMPVAPVVVWVIAVKAVLIQIVGVAEGGLLESVIDGENGILLPENPETKDLIKAVEKMTPKLAIGLKEKCQLQAQKFAPKKFFQKLDLLLEEGLEGKSR